MLVPLVEEGWLEHHVTKQVIDEYLAPLLEGGVDTIVLGCTHYPLLKPLLCRAVGAGVNLIDSAAETAAELCRVLEDRDLRAANGTAPKHRFVASDDPLQFLQLGQRFLGDTIESVDVHTFA
jgi:glutamate racemase